MIGKRQLHIAMFALTISSAKAICPYDSNCMNNPFTGRNAVATRGGDVVAPFGRYSTNQLNPEFGASELRNGGIGNPYAPAPKTTIDSGTSANPLYSGLGSGMSGSNSSLQGVDPDLRR